MSEVTCNFPIVEESELIPANPLPHSVAHSSSLQNQQPRAEDSLH